VKENRTSFHVRFYQTPSRRHSFDVVTTSK